MNTHKKRSGFKVMTSLIGLVKPMTGYMILAILMGLMGHLCASFITISGGFAILSVLEKNSLHLAVIFAGIFGKVTQITGYNVSDIEELIYLEEKTAIKINELLFAGILIASLGAVMDVGMSIASTLQEIYSRRPDLGMWDLFKSGMNVGKDMMGTMSNTLILAFVGSAVSELVINYAYNLPFRQIINSYNIGIEIMQGVSGSIGVILTVPAVAVVTAWMLTRGEHAKNEGNVAE